MASSDLLPDSVVVSNAPGTLRVWVSRTGLPLHVEIAPALLSGGVAMVADEVVELCRRAAAR